MFTPYTDEVNAFVRQTMETFGVHIASICGMGLSNDVDIAALTPEQILAFTRDKRDTIPATADLCFFSCTNVRSAEIRQQLSALVSKPFITSNQCFIDYVRALPRIFPQRPLPAPHALQTNSARPDTGRGWIFYAPPLRFLHRPAIIKSE